MFEQTPEQMIATVYVEGRDSKLADQYGVVLPAGANRLSFAAAVALVRQLDRALAGVVYVRNQKRVRALRNQIVFAFGPDMEAAL